MNHDEHPFQKKISYLVLENIDTQRMSDYQLSKQTGPEVTFRIHDEDNQSYTDKVQKCSFEAITMRDLNSLILNLTGNRPFFLDFNVNNKMKASSLLELVEERRKMKK